jgi:hypothetical protein
LKKKLNNPKDPIHFVDRYNEVQAKVEELKQPIESKPSDVIDVGEKYQIVTGIDEDQAGGIDPRLLPNLHQKWMPSELSEGRPYNSKLYKSAAEQEFYEGFIQPLFKIYKSAKFRHGMDIKNGIRRNHWERRINMDALGPEKALFEGDDGKTHALLGEVEIILILAVHVMDDLTRYQPSKVAKRIGCSIEWLRKFRKRIQNAYGKMAIRSVEDHLELQMMRCEGVLDTFMTEAREGDPYAAKIAKDFMDKEDQYIMPTLDQLSFKDTPEEKIAVLERVKKIVSDSLEAKKIEDKNDNRKY